MPDAPSATLVDRVHAFLTAFSQATDPVAAADSFADPFLLADASGSRPVPRAAFLAALPDRERAFRDAGLGSLVLADVSCQRLDETYVLARGEWDAPRTGGGEPLRVASSFLLQQEGRTFRVVLYLNHLGLPTA
ncbi:DUF4440 domain-containing protein [Micromonospora musae]|uniref:DUF4440 domain-containing protein n=1 Tax=Micromonospora musae TaxID=1894970 RepID=UPI0033C85A57